uniref:transposase n=1 Tax=Okeania sp. SIO2F4 TaxID=2607790 RepID=UPI0025DF9E1E|nr:transposase [Okeania sp. SIO2F4]
MYCKEGLESAVLPWEDHQKILIKNRRNKLKSDERLRNNIEGKFGQAKRGFSLEKVMPKLPETSATAIAITFLVINLSTLLKEDFSLFLYFFGEKTVFAVCLIILTYG